VTGTIRGTKATFKETVQDAGPLTKNLVNVQKRRVRPSKKKQRHELQLRSSVRTLFPLGGSSTVANRRKPTQKKKTSTPLNLKTPGHLKKFDWGPDNIESIDHQKNSQGKPCLGRRQFWVRGPRKERTATTSEEGKRVSTKLGETFVAYHWER